MRLQNSPTKYPALMHRAASVVPGNARACQSKTAEPDTISRHRQLRRRTSLFTTLTTYLLTGLLELAAVLLALDLGQALGLGLVVEEQSALAGKQVPALGRFLHRQGLRDRAWGGRGG
jgi:hypothetical protein